MKILSLGCLLGGVVLAVMPMLALADELPMYFTPDWKTKEKLAQDIAGTMAKASGLEIKPHIIGSNSDLVVVFAKKEPAIVYVGSMVTAILNHRGLVNSLAQGVNNKEMYTAVLIAPTAAGADAKIIVKEAGTAISYAKGFSSGELGAKAASDGQADIAVKNHVAALDAVKQGKAKAAFVKNWWWEDNKGNYPEMKMLEYPGVSELKNPDNVLSVSKSVAVGDAEKVKNAAFDNPRIFQVRYFKDFEDAMLKGTLELMSKAKVDPDKYSW